MASESSPESSPPDVSLTPNSKDMQSKEQAPAAAAAIPVPVPVLAPAGQSAASALSNEVRRVFSLGSLTSPSMQNLPFVRSKLNTGGSPPTSTSANALSSEPLKRSSSNSPPATDPSPPSSAQKAFSALSAKSLPWLTKTFSDRDGSAAAAKARKAANSEAEARDIDSLNHSGSEGDTGESFFSGAAGMRRSQSVREVVKSTLAKAVTESEMLGSNLFRMPGSAGGSNSNISNTKLEVDTTTTNSHKSSRRGSTTYPRSSLTTRNGDSVAEAAVAFLASPDSLGFSLASKKRNTDFHDLFPTLPRDDLLVDDFSCAWQKEVLIQGRMYISERHVCFYANILGWVHSVELPFASITALEKRNVAAIIPNAIEVSVGDVKYFFASFLHREESFCLLVRLWDLSAKKSFQLRTIKKPVEDETEELAVDDVTAEGLAAKDDTRGRTTISPNSAPTPTSAPQKQPTSRSHSADSLQDHTKPRKRTPKSKVGVASASDSETTTMSTDKVIPPSVADGGRKARDSSTHQPTTDHPLPSSDPTDPASTSIAPALTLPTLHRRHTGKPKTERSEVVEKEGAWEDVGGEGVNGIRGEGDEQIVGGGGEAGGEEVVQADIFNVAAPSPPTPPPTSHPRPHAHPHTQTHARSLKKKKRPLKQQQQQQATPADCACGPEHDAMTPVLNAVFPVPVHVLWRLMYGLRDSREGFLRWFLVGRKCHDFKLVDWNPPPNGDLPDPETDVPLDSEALTSPQTYDAVGVGWKRKLAYVVPLSGAIGPKQTQCKLEETVVKRDEGRSICILQISRTPDVPSGTAFQSRLKLCLTSVPPSSASPISNSCHTRLRVSCQVEWLKSSWLKTPINAAVPEGLREYHNALEGAVREWCEANPQSREVESGDGTQQEEAESDIDIDVKDSAEDHAGGRDTTSTSTPSPPPPLTHPLELELAALAKNEARRAKIDALLPAKHRSVSAGHAAAATTTASALARMWPSTATAGEAGVRAFVPATKRPGSGGENGTRKGGSGWNWGYWVVRAVVGVVVAAGVVWCVRWVVREEVRRVLREMRERGQCLGEGQGVEK